VEHTRPIYRHSLSAGSLIRSSSFSEGVISLPHELEASKRRQVGREQAHIAALAQDVKKLWTPVLT
jgi:hypothetical protein